MNLLEVYNIDKRPVALRSMDWKIVIMSLEQMVAMMEDPKLGSKDTSLLREIIQDIKQQIGA